MKAAAVAVAIASLAAPALALVSARPGEGFRILRRADSKFCEEVRKTTETKCKAGSGIQANARCYAAGRDAEMGCFVDNIKVPETSDAVHEQCRTAAVKGSQVDCFEKTWGTCMDEQVKAYPDCVKKANIATASGPSQGQGQTPASTGPSSSQDPCSGAAQPSAQVQASQENPEYPAWIILQELCSSESDRDGIGNAPCKKNVEECLEESKKFNNVKDCVAKKNSTVDSTSTQASYSA